MSIVIIISLYVLTSTVLKKSLGFFEKLSLLDRPTERSNHSIIKPKGAGLILIPFLIFSTLLIFFLKDLLSQNWILIFGFCGILFSISLLDDLRNVSSRIRLTFQFFCVISALLVFQEDLHIFLGSIIQNISDETFSRLIIVLIICLLVISWVWVINLFNFMDGMDGITAVQVSSIAICTNIFSIMGLISTDFLYFGLIILTIFLAFFSVNKPPAKIFLGDVGSIPIGFIIGFIIIYNGIKYDIFIPFLICMMYYILDSTITLLLRLLKKENIFEAHSSHFYQKVLRKGYSHNFVLNRLILLNLALMFLSFLSIDFPFTSLLIAVFLSGFLIYFFESRRQQ